ncbi:hypothetical protein [Mucilaginibacter jinjuensis]|uniref:Uncharacterized protein n=1 Tax=Mucilaginibacter jinjuensis TaxID=1176721 RepID=A0ABY7TD56_9SPHI|nr:hypothetical protein [Mucilaginibacter jinjuensis]WCT14459.1 hypothetical protein PQO05_10995 [Mucilaginibacter jinjuensis]
MKTSQSFSVAFTIKKEKAKDGVTNLMKFMPDVKYFYVYPLPFFSKLNASWAF